MTLTANAADWEGDVCGSCGAPIVFAIHVRTLKRAPINGTPSPDGTIELIPREGMEPLWRDLKPQQRFGKKNLRRSHFTDCPQADRWRRR